VKKVKKVVAMRAIEPEPKGVTLKAAPLGIEEE